ncbi:peptidase u61 ld-carboxypeptidase a protein [Pochonia chlamydosporia 170]|uniref:Peptidase u61 ld-carboxypeptidase a protein n=1 Tax=Pochonia chlamydosporia 170 TaxID=1380566 RepID=A0A179FK29_METCM|nr:peptidase u61 ld-carboxypeptidase a protein [Pochonia chlamydosporia 170]OAQ65359.1 peptidase u61 ld-carboxypeptidase a protein [Pochonia chlamydosporia 170]
MATSITPPALRRGDTIAFVAPSARINHIFPLRIARARAFLEGQGFKVREIYSHEIPTDSFRAAVKTRVEEIHDAFRDDAVKAIVCAIGGLTANEIIPHLDYELIRSKPKIFIGSSDITLLHYALFAGAELRTFYGPSAITQLGEFPNPLEFTWDHFTRVLLADAESAASEPVGKLPRAAAYTDEFLDWSSEPDNLRARKTEPSQGWKWLRPGHAEGRIFGGCLPSLLQLFGTPWQVSYKGRILLLELPEGMEPSSPWPLELVRWNLADLGTRGVWDDITGLVLGRPYRHTAEQTAEWEKMVLELTEGYEFPILAGVDVGHTDPMLTVPLDALCTLDSERDEWVILERGVTG